MRFLRTYFYDDCSTFPVPISIYYSPYGMYSADNATFVDPYEKGFDPDLLYANHAQSGMNISDSMHHDIHMGMTYLYEYDLQPEDTLWFYVGYFSQMTTCNPDGKTLQQNVEDILDYFYEYLIHGWSPCILPGDINYSGGVDISDLTYYVDYMFSGGPPPVWFELGDVNADCELNISDLTYFVAYLFAGGAEPECRDDCSY